PCTLDHFPNALLKTGGADVDVPVQPGAKAQKLKLAKGDSATFTITYVRGKDGDKSALAAKTVQIALPGSDSGRSFPWSYGPVAPRGSPNTPDASVRAFQQVGDCSPARQPGAGSDLGLVRRSRALRPARRIAHTAQPGRGRLGEHALQPA